MESSQNERTIKNDGNKSHQSSGSLRQAKVKQLNEGFIQTRNSSQEVPGAIRGLILASIMLWNVGFWSITDFPQTLGDHILDHFGIDEVQIGFIYFTTYLVSIFASPSAGFLISRFGLPNVALGASFLMWFSTFTMYFAVQPNPSTCSSWLERSRALEPSPS